MRGVACSWCGVGVDPEDGFRVGEPLGERCAAFCRLEHITPWAMHGAHWEAGPIEFVPDDALEQHAGWALCRC